MSKNVEHIRPVSERKNHKRQSMTRSTEKQEAATITNRAQSMVVNLFNQHIWYQEYECTPI